MRNGDEIDFEQNAFDAFDDESDLQLCFKTPISLKCVNHQQIKMMFI